MSIFNFFRSRNPIQEAKELSQGDEDKEPTDKPLQPAIEITASPEISEHIFIEHAIPKAQTMESNENIVEKNDLQTLYRYLEQNLEKKGYEDALVNPDSSYMEEHVLYITNELSLIISKIKTYYSGYLRTIDFHIETRKRSAMVETVDELLSHKATILEEIQTVASIENDSINGKGLSQNLILSYKKGFRNGFAAITYNQVLNRK